MLTSLESQILQCTCMIEGVEFRIFVPRVLPGSEGSRAPFEIVVLGRCRLESCNRVLPANSRGGFCDNNDICKNAYHYLRNKLLG